LYVYVLTRTKNTTLKTQKRQNLKKHKKIYLKNILKTLKNKKKI